jgi:hypothetical protein
MRRSAWVMCFVLTAAVLLIAGQSGVGWWAYAEGLDSSDHSPPSSSATTAPATLGAGPARNLSCHSLAGASAVIPAVDRPLWNPVRSATPPLHFTLPTIPDTLSDVDLGDWARFGRMPRRVREVLDSPSRGSVRGLHEGTVCTWPRGAGFVGCVANYSTVDVRDVDEMIIDAVAVAVAALRPAANGGAWTDDLCVRAASMHSGVCLVLNVVKEEHTARQRPSPTAVEPNTTNVNSTAALAAGPDGTASGAATCAVRVSKHDESWSAIPSTTLKNAATAMLAHVSDMLAVGRTFAPCFHDDDPASHRQVLLPMRLAGSFSSSDSLAFWAAHPHMALSTIYRVTPQSQAQTDSPTEAGPASPLGGSTSNATEGGPASPLGRPASNATAASSDIATSLVGAALFGPEFDAAVAAHVAPGAERQPTFLALVERAEALGCPAAASIVLRRGAWDVDTGALAGDDAPRHWWHDERSSVALLCVAAATGLSKVAALFSTRTATNQNLPHVRVPSKAAYRDRLVMPNDLPAGQCVLHQPEDGGHAGRARVDRRRHKTDRLRPRARTADGARAFVATSDFSTGAKAAQAAALALASGAAPLMLVSNESVAVRSHSPVGLPVALAGGLMLPWVHYLPLDVSQLSPTNTGSKLGAELSDRFFVAADVHLERTARNSRYLFGVILQPSFRHAYHSLLLRTWIALHRPAEQQP